MLLLLLLFILLENVSVFPPHYLQLPFDRAIPFIPQFIWIYLAWFPYIIISFFWFSSKDHGEYIRLTKMIIVGWAAFLIFSFICPTALNLRPASTGEGLSALACSIVYSVDTPTNVFPSMHVYVTLCFAVAFARRAGTGDHTPALFRVVAPALTVLIPLSALFVKQHSVFDVLASCVMAAVMYRVVYGAPRRAEQSVRQRVFRRIR